MKWETINTVTGRDGRKYRLSKSNKSLKIEVWGKKGRKYKSRHFTGLNAGASVHSYLHNTGAKYRIGKLEAREPKIIEDLKKARREIDNAQHSLQTAAMRARELNKTDEVFGELEGRIQFAHLNPITALLESIDTTLKRYPSSDL